MKNLAELKKLQIGTKLKLIYSHYPWKNGIQLPITRRIQTVQSNALTLEPIAQNPNPRPSWLYFPKAADFEGTNTGFKILEDGKVLLEYEVVV